MSVKLDIMKKILNLSMFVFKSSENKNNNQLEFKKAFENNQCVFNDIDESGYSALYNVQQSIGAVSKLLNEKVFYGFYCHKYDLYISLHNIEDYIVNNNSSFDSIEIGFSLYIQNLIKKYKIDIQDGYEYDEKENAAYVTINVNEKKFIITVDKNTSDVLKIKCQKTDKELVNYLEFEKIFNVDEDDDSLMFFNMLKALAVIYVTS